MNNKTKYNKYVSMKRYNDDIKYGSGNIISNPNKKYRCSKKDSIPNLNIEENFVSLSSAVRRPFSPSYYFPNYIQPHVDGV